MLVSVRKIADLVDGELVGSQEGVVRGVAPLEQAGPEDISFAVSEKYRGLVRQTQAGAVLVPLSFQGHYKTTLVRVQNPYLAMAKMARRWERGVSSFQEGLPTYVTGILNLRGQIVTVIDLGKKLGLTSTELNESTRNIIVNSENEYIGLLVSSISDVVEAQWDKVEDPPANIGGVQGVFFKGVYKTQDRLIGILDVNKVLAEENS